MEKMQWEMDRVLEHIRREAAERQTSAERKHALVKFRGGPLVKQR